MIHDIEQTVYDRLYCSVDPVTAVGSALFGLIPGLMMGGNKSPQAPTATPDPVAPPTPDKAATPVLQPQGIGGSTQKAGGGANQSSFIGSAAVPAQQGYGAKTLLGQ